MTLDTLPTDIKCLILNQISDPRTLSALISASPQYLHVYGAFEKHVLSQITWNYITPRMMPLAMYLLEQSKIDRGLRHDPTAVHLFLKDFQPPHFSFSDLPVERSLSPETSTELIRFHNVVEYFVSRFTDDRLTDIETLERWSKARTMASARKQSDLKFSRVLSATEHSRLVRAFYHVELYGHLFYYKNDIPQTERTLFLEKLRDFELAEFLCIRTYLLERLWTFEQVMQSDSRQYDSQRVAEIELSPGGWFFGDDGQGAMERWMDGCLTRGLGTLRDMFEADTIDSRFVALGDTDGPENNTLEESLEQLPLYPEQPPWPNSHVVEPYNDPESHNYGWELRVKGRGHPRCSKEYVSGYAEGVLQRSGYAFWDKDRFESIRDGNPRR